MMRPANRSPGGAKTATPVRRSVIAAHLVLLTALGAAHTAAAQPAPPAQEKADQAPSLRVTTSQAHLVQLDRAAATVSVANPDIADIQTPDTSTFIVVGKKPGATTIFVIYPDRRTASYNVVVSRPTADVAEALAREAPEARIQVSSTPNGLIVSGTAPTPQAAERLRAVASQFLGEKEQLAFNVSVGAAVQVNLRVRVAEVSHDVSREMGSNWSALFNNGNVAVGLLTGRTPTQGFGQFARSPTGLDSLGAAFHNADGTVDMSALIDALASEGRISILAEPNLTATSGETANFLAGGEFPIPVPQSNNEVTVEFKRFGVGVDFTPTVLNANRLSIKVRSEVSELSSNGAIVLNNISVPSLTVRRTETTVELGSGQSFAIAGLFQNNASADVSRFPWLGDIPVLGALFRSKSFSHNQSELVIIITPYIVGPVSDPSQLKLPTDSQASSDKPDSPPFDRVAAAQPKPAGARSLRQQGQAGIITE